MALITVDRARRMLTVELTGLDKLWALKSRTEVPLTTGRHTRPGYRP
ncbi:hypothetical protein [Streptomyces aureus]|uniref:Uncharacterized protein n=1 Tax=Streptomyces aureus TaxID=193461 RepID=A0ABV4SH99_9ACTN